MMDKLESCVTELVAAYVSNNHVAPDELPALIVSVRTSLVGLADTPQVGASKPMKVTEAEVRKSITPEFLISFLDGRSYKALKRHLRSNGLDPESYRARFGLPSNYPMVAAGYSARRSEISRSREHWKRNQP